ncbi:MAG TPA: hypothetical protein VHW24_19195 [Bryobacteraceae bacterium]|jgi:hypothetical protein|nr:hypothetical protein [Bryobacteraceae bacterium]
MTGAWRVCVAILVAAWSTEAATATREQEIDKTARAIEQECQRAAGGDWQKWFDQTASARAALNSRIEDGFADVRESPDKKIKHALYRMDGKPPFFEMPDYAEYVGLHRRPGIASCEDWVSRFDAWKIVLAASLWFKEHGIDLIFVPVPHLAEVYGARIAGNVPDDIVIAPYLRKTLLALSRQNVEIVDLLPEFLKQRGSDDDALFLAADPHWSDRAKRIAATEVARRLRRYPWAAAAMAKPPRYKMEEKDLPVRGYFLPLLTDSEKAELGPPVVMRSRVITTQPAGETPGSTEGSSVMVIGDSYATYRIVPGTGFFQQLMQQINQPVTLRAAEGGITQMFKDLARDMESLRSTRVVIWVINGSSFAQSWPDLPPLPKRH